MRPAPAAATEAREHGRSPVSTALRLLLLTLLLNVVRYTLGAIIEIPVVAPLFSVMGDNPEYFDTSFTTWDRATSYFYNFCVWFAAVVAFHVMHPSLRGGWLARSLQAWGLMWFFFAAVSAVYMNHYAHPKSFYGWNVLDALLMFGLLAFANALLYPRVVLGRRRRERRLPGGNGAGAA